MADTRIENLPSLSAMSADDIIPVVDNPTVTPITKQITRTNFMGGVSVLQVVGTTETQTITGKTISGALNTITNLSLTSGVTGTLPVANGGTGAVTLTGLLLGNGTSSVTTITTSAGLASTISDETGTGALVFATSPTLVTPDLGIPSAATLTNASGTATNLTSGITNALKSATTTVNVSSATAPTSGQVLTATGASAATWQTPTITTTQYGPRGFLINGKIVPSVSSNNLTVAVKGMDGNDPSATNPVYIRIGDTVRTISAALSVTAAAGTNWENAGSTELATQEIDYGTYIGYNATDGVTVGFARIFNALQYGDFSTTSTNEKYARISTITNAASTDVYELVGRFAATLSAGAGFTWTIPTFTALNLIQRPIFETRLLSWVPVFTGFSVAPSGVVARYQINNSRMFIHVNMAAGTSNATGFTFTLPFNNNATVMANLNGGQTFDNSAPGTFAPLLNLPVSSATVTAFKDFTGPNWTNSGSKYIDRLSGIYQI